MVEFGLHNVWIKWFEQTGKHKILLGQNTTGPERNFITFNNLSKFFLLYFSVLGSFLFVFVVDKIRKSFSVNCISLELRCEFLALKSHSHLLSIETWLKLSFNVKSLIVRPNLRPKSSVHLNLTMCKVSRTLRSIGFYLVRIIKNVKIKFVISNYK